ncbi:MAG: thioredoxin-disulfide reductase [Holosporaceae bacterium]|jgi:thioredoxin reductase (NADPH)|nr:thioredoxin-disulfide reductase [Holosporaceae bacterium]
MESDILIIGSGPAGYTASIYAARAGRKTALIIGPQQGGQLMITSFIENYPGFADPISGPELMECMRKQAENVAVEMVQDTISAVDFSMSPLKCIGESGTEYCGRAVIIATGASAKWLGIPGESAYRGRGVSSCATCDGFFFKNKNVAVIGGGNTAVEEATYLTNFARSVTLIHRRDSLRAEKLMQRRFLDNPKINVLWNTTVTEIIGDGSRVTELLLRNVLDNSVSQVPIDGVFVAIGHRPATSIFAEKVAMDENGYIITQNGSQQTSVPGVFAAGDVCDPVYRQAATSVGQGCMAAMEVDRFLSINV